MNDPVHIVVVDDEPDLREMLQEYLHTHGFEVTALDGGAALRQAVQRDRFDLALLDINMPGEDGLSLGRYMREHTQASIIFLTAAGETIDRIIGLEMGADDYITKPFDLREVIARINAVLQWRRRAQTGTLPGDTRTVRFGACRLDLEGRRLYGAGGSELPLTDMEFELLKTFAEHPNIVLDRDRLLELTHPRSDEPFDRSIDVRIARIRRKIEIDPGKPQVIKTVRGAGYMFVPG